MKQQINLYVREVKVQIPFSAAKCALILLITTAVVAGLWGMQSARLQGLKREMASLQAEQRQYDEQIETLTRQLKPPAESPALKAEVAALSGELAAKRRFGDLLAQLQPDRRTAFSQLLGGLASQTPDGVWLTRIRAEAGGVDFSLEGHALKASLVPRFIEQLGREPGYRQARFGSFLLNEQERTLRFEVGAVLVPGRQDG